MEAVAGERSVSGVRVLITGGGSGLGRAMAVALVRAGARVLVGSRDPGRHPPLEADIADAAGALRVVPLDVRDEASCAGAISAARRWLGGLDVLVNNAGLGMRFVHPGFMTDAAPFWTVGPDAFRAVVDTNLTGYFLMARAAAPHFLAQGGGHIVNITVNRDTMTRRGFVPYGPSRAGSEALSRVMEQDFAPYGVRVNQLLPGGATATGMIPDDVPPGVRERLLDPAIMGPPICFLCSPEAERLTGARIVARDFAAWIQDYRAAHPRPRSAP